ncbi:Quercetin 2,3-dioxygenase [Pirellula sp. SH-Sr6A]|uniref:pirin family protein n=1 Tax=Pirellula sp. SH-Sr6A TaxID=1632865 RepID=UPI00078C9946|nr:pirin family protein [Pirellula sp. SH-Sr6A]AMV32162.1 Quercetin 2,3-dioxygenase [Pirellula sp. SH-Sr6A]
MFQVRKRDERGFADHGWLRTFHTFSFSDYQDPRHVQFRSLRVMNEDWIAPGQGFGTHPHRNMEIVTYVLEGALEHRDSMGNGEVLTPGEFQRMTAGSGITHSEFNPSATEPVHLYQIWLYPKERELEPSYEQKRFAPEEQFNRWRLVASPNGDEGSLLIHQDARIYLATLDSVASLEREFAPSRHGWLQVLRGAVDVEGHHLVAGDGMAVSDESIVRVKKASDPSQASEAIAEIMVFDLA